MTKTLLAAAIAFAMAFTVIPSAFVCAAGDNTDPTGTASEMVTDGDVNGAGGTSDPSGNTDITPGEDGNTTEDKGEVPGVIDNDLNLNDLSESTDTPEQDQTTAAPTAGTTAPSTTKSTTVPTTVKKKWTVPKGKKTLSLSICCNPDGTVFDLVSQAGQKLYKYDTLQGATAGKGYGYFTLYNRKNNRVKIVKVRLKDMQVVKVSAALNLKHANEITYNNRKNIIVVANSTPTPKKLTVINASTLKVKYVKTLKVTRKVKGMSSWQRKKFRGVGAIAYNEKHNIYICRMRKSYDLLFLNSKLKPYKRIRQNSRVSGMIYQGMDSYKDCIMIVQSFKGKKKYNLITVYNMKGKYKARFKLPLGFPPRELQTVFHDGNQFYVGVYCSYGAKEDLQKLHIKRENFIYKTRNL